MDAKAVVVVLCLLLAGCSGQSGASKEESAPRSLAASPTPMHVDGPEIAFRIGVGASLELADARHELQGRVTYAGTAVAWDAFGMERLVHNFTRISNPGERQRIQYYYFHADSGALLGRQLEAPATLTHWVDFGQGPLPWGPIGGLFLLLHARSAEAQEFRIGETLFIVDPVGSRSAAGDCDWHKLVAEPSLARATYHLCVDAKKRPLRSAVEGFEDTTYVYQTDTAFRFTFAPQEVLEERRELRRGPWQSISQAGTTFRVPPAGSRPNELASMGEAMMREPTFQPWLGLHPKAYLSQATFFWRNVAASLVGPVPGGDLELAIVTAGEGTSRLHFNVFRTPPAENDPSVYIATRSGETTMPWALRDVDELPPEYVTLGGLRAAYLDRLPNLDHKDAKLPAYWWIANAEAAGFDPRVHMMWMMAESCEKKAGGGYVTGQPPRYAFFSAVTGQMTASGPVRSAGDGCGMTAPNYQEDDGSTVSDLRAHADHSDCELIATVDVETANAALETFRACLMQRAPPLT